jgi:nitrogen fixation protein FixH
MAPEGIARHGLAVAGLLLCLVAACNGRSTAEDFRITWALDPSAPSTSTDTVVRLSIADRDQRPITGARLRLEAHMPHPGMAPVVTELTERGPGEFDARLRFTMAGDWSLVLTGVMPDGRRLTEQTRVAGVRASN